MTASLTKSGLFLSTFILGINMVSVFGLYSYLSYFANESDFSSFILLLSLIQVFSGGYGGNVSQLIIREISKSKTKLHNYSSSVIFSCIFYAFLLSLLVTILAKIFIVETFAVSSFLILFFAIFFEFVIFINIAALRSIYSSSVPTIFLALRYFFTIIFLFILNEQDILNLNLIVLCFFFSSVLIGLISTGLFLYSFQKLENFRNVRLISKEFFSFYVSGSFNGLKVNLPIFFFSYFSFNSIPSYKIASQLALVLNSLRASFAIYFTPHYADAIANNDEKNFMKSFKQNHIFLLVISFTIFIIFLAAGKNLIDIFFNVDSIFTITIALILCLEALVGIILPLDVFMNLKKLDKYVLYVNIFLFTSQAALMYFFFIMFGVIGVALLYVLLAIIVSVYCYIISISKMKILAFPFWKILD